MTVIDRFEDISIQCLVYLHLLVSDALFAGNSHAVKYRVILIADVMLDRGINLGVCVGYSVREQRES